jgi:type IV secretion system protein VirD4
MDERDLEAEDFAMRKGRIFLGKTNATGRMIGIDDNRHIVTIAGSRAGKSTTSLIPNLLTWDGSAIVIDPKGELARDTAGHRAKLGQEVCILDPFGEVKIQALQRLRKAYDPLEGIRKANPDSKIDEAAILADALIATDGNKTDHWTLSAKNLIRGFILYALYRKGAAAKLNDVRHYLSLPYEDENDDTSETMQEHFQYMREYHDAFDGVLAGVGGSMIGKPPNERGSIISTANEHMAFLDSKMMQDHLASADMPSLDMLKQRPTTIYLVLKASQMATHFRWLRAVLSQAMTALENAKNATGRPVLFILEEFPTLGYMRLIESAAGLMAGYDVKLWTVIQDLTQMQAHYPRSWETFIGNAGIVETFGNTDSTTLEYLSKRLGMTLARQPQPQNLSLEARKQGEALERDSIVSVPLMAPHEIAQAFDRDNQNKLVMRAGKAPFHLQRVFWKDMPRL